jgi:hypothetical protein
MRRPKIQALVFLSYFYAAGIEGEAQFMARSDHVTRGQEHQQLANGEV